MKPYQAITCLAITFLSAYGCNEVPTDPVEQIIDAQYMPVSENGVYTDDGRFFVAGKDTVYEVTGGPNNYTAHVLFHDADCGIGGLVSKGNVLYLPCNRDQVTPSFAELIRLDPANPDAPILSQASFPSELDSTLLNGMAFGPDGTLYITNSLATLAGDAAILKVDILNEIPLEIQVDNFLPMASLSDFDQSGGLFPNGIQFDGDTLYFSRGLSVVKLSVFTDGSHGELESIYTTGSLSVIDDFSIIDGKIFMAFTRLAGLIAPNTFESKVVVTDLNGAVLREIPMPVLPSSIATRRDTLFGDEAVVVTSFFDGGLYRFNSY